MSYIKQKLIITVLIFSTALFAANSSYAEIDMPEFKLTPYGGIDVGMQHIGFKAGYGDNLFEKHLPKGNIFVGLKFNDYFGVEGGYESTIQKTKNVTLGANDTYLGMTTGIGGPFNMNPGENLKASTKIKISGWHFGITTEYPIYVNNVQNSLSLTSYLGLKKTRINLSSTTLIVAGVVDNGIDLLNHDNKKTLFKLSAGLQYFINNNFGLKISGSWENTSKFQPYNTKNTLRASLKNSISYSLGFLFKE